MSTVIQRSFSGGELSPSLYARVDISKYATGARTLRNMIVQRHGGAQNRPGSMFVGEVAYSDTPVRLVPFVFNNSQTYVLEFGEQYMRVIKQGGYVTDSTASITGITQADPAVVTANAHGFTDGQEVYVSGVSGMTQVNNRNFKVANATTNTFELQDMDFNDVDSTGYDAYSSGGTAYEIYEISTPYDDADLMDLQYVQSADVVTIVHPDYAPRELSRTGDASWTLSTITFTPGIAAPSASLSGSAGGAGSKTFQYVITSIADETLEESLQSSTITISSAADPTDAAPHTLSWGTVSGATEYNVYKALNGVYGFIGVAAAGSFLDTGIPADTTKTPPENRTLFNSSGNYPSAVTYYQQRLGFANSTNDPEKIWFSKSGQFKNFSASSPIQDDDAVTFTMAGRQVNEVRHMIDLRRLVVLTTGGEWAIQGGASGVLTPTEINPTQYSYNGSSSLPPIIIGGNALYVQARGSIVRDLGFDFESDGYRGNDLTVFSSHLFDDYTLTDWAYQQVPHSVLWAVRSDGTLLGLTYLREQSMLAWHRHDFNGGVVENVCVVPENNRDALYVVVKRTINGVSKRYVERLSDRQITDIVDATFMDSFLTYDGRNTASTTMTLSGGTDWTYEETLTLTASASSFSSASVGRAVHLTATDGTVVRCEITAYSSATVVSVTPNRTVPASLRSTATASWSLAISEVTGLWHLEGEEVSVFGDGFVVANPNNSAYDTVTVTNGTVTLDKNYAVIHVGLPFLADLELLDIDFPDGETLADKREMIPAVTVFVESTRGVWAGPQPPTSDTDDPLENLTEFKARNAEDYDLPVSLRTGTIDINIQGRWNDHGRVFLRQVDPLPMSVLAVARSGFIPLRG